MSPYEPFEYPRNIVLENSTADLVLANSEETKQMLIDAGINKGLVQIMGNPAPDEFFNKSPRDLKERLQKVLVVSNHFPDEGMKALELLEKQGISTECVGASFEHSKLITPDLVNGADAVITIGKTVQFALLAKVPVYVYDHFGGPGYLTEKNYQKAKQYNFSGRGFDVKKPASTIAEELVSGFANAQTSINKLSEKHSETFLFSSKMGEVLDAVMSLEPKRLSIDKGLWQAMIINNKLLRRTFLSSMHHQALSAEVVRLDDLLRGKQAELESTAASLHEANLAIQNQHHRLNRFPVRHLDALLNKAAANRWARRFMLLVRSFKKDSSARNILKGRLYLLFRSLPFSYKYIKGQNGVKPLIVGLVRERNESLLLKDTLDHLSSFVDGIVVFDDASTDDSVKIALEHPSVLEVIVNKKWQKNRTWEETSNRAVLLKRAKSFSPEWFFYSDADERFEGDIRNYLIKECPEDVDGIRISLFDAYITPEDKEPFKKGSELLGFRKFFGPERRDILMIWRNKNSVAYLRPDSREPSGIDENRIATKFFCQHYGKSLSIEHWEETCRYYVDNFPQYSDKWKERTGKAVHSKSDFGTELQVWDKVKKGGVRIN